MLLPKLGGLWLFPPRDFPHLNESHPMDHDSVSSGHTNIASLTPGLPQNPDSGLTPATNKNMLIRLTPNTPKGSVRLMTRPDFPKTLRELQRRFADESACRAYLVASRWPDGSCCPRCGHGEAFRLPRRHLMQCKACGLQTSVAAGTGL